MMQTWGMFLNIHMPTSVASTATALSVETMTEASPSTPATRVALDYITNLFSRLLGRSSPGSSPQFSFFPTTYFASSWLTLDSLVTTATTLLILLLLYTLLLCLKLLLGMLLLSYSRKRYRSMQTRAHTKTETAGKRFGGWGAVEVEEEKRRWIYRDDPEALERIREKEGKVAREREREREGAGGGRGADGFVEKIERVRRYDMVAKRIW